MRPFLLAGFAFVTLGAPVWAINGIDLALRSNGTADGTDWELGKNGYVGTYFTLAEDGDVTIDVNASGTAFDGVDPHMNLVVADTSVGFDVPSGFDNYQHTFSLPAGTYVLRTEFNNDREKSSRALTVRDVSITGATVSNVSDSTNALAAADTYIEHFRKGNAAVHLPGVSPGTMVDVSLKRHAFNFGTAIPGSFGVNSYLGSDGTDKQVNYQAMLNANFNSVVPENAGKWGNQEFFRDSEFLGSMDTILNYAASHNMRARMHNMIWGDNGANGQQPSWILNNNQDGLLDLAYTDGGAYVDELTGEINERIDYYVGTGSPGDRSLLYDEIDVYNESYHTGSNPTGGPHNYWNVYGTEGIADIYRRVKQAVADAGGSTKAYVNEYGVLGGSDYASWYMDHIDSLRNAGIEAGYGDVVDGIGAQYYPGSYGAYNPAFVMATLQNLSVQGLPITLTEFGVSNVDASYATGVLNGMVRLMFGNAAGAGFFMWGFHRETGPGANQLYAGSAALYTVDTSDWTDWSITKAGLMWNGLLSVENPNSAWNTQLTAEVDENGDILFDGFYGDYAITVGGETYDLLLEKGTTSYQLATGSGLPGDYNGNNIVDAADYAVWRDAMQAGASTLLNDDSPGSVTEADFIYWRDHFGETAGAGAASAAVPEPASWLLLVAAALVIALCRPPPWRRGARRLLA